MMKWKTIFNPFEKFTEKQLLLAGVVVTLVGSVVGWLKKVSFDGIFDVHGPIERTLQTSLLENIVNISFVFIVLFVLGKILNKKTRAIDILNTAMIYRIPLYILALFSNIPWITRQSEKILEGVKAGVNPTFSIEMLVVFLYGMLLLPFIAYAIVLITNGFKTAANVKKWQHFVAFAIVLLVTEILSKPVLQYLIH